MKQEYPVHFSLPAALPGNYYNQKCEPGYRDNVSPADKAFTFCFQISSLNLQVNI
jgi:hypothetical protein